jgi:hypothetical protein
MSRTGLAGLALAVCVACAAPAGSPPSAAPPAAAVAQAPPRTLQLANAGFESGMKPEGRCAIGWDCTMHLNPDSFRFSLLESGAAAERRALCVERVFDEPWALVTQAFQNPAPLRGKRLRLSMAVRVEGASGAGAGPWILSQSRPVANASRLANGTSGWQRLSVEITVPKDAGVVEVGATLEGPGKACFDDVRVEVL